MGSALYTILLIIIVIVTAGFITMYFKSRTKGPSVPQVKEEPTEKPENEDSEIG